MEGDARSNGSERRLAWISRTPRGAIADWEERSLSPPAPGTDMPVTPDPNRVRTTTMVRFRFIFRVFWVYNC